MSGWADVDAWKRQRLKERSDAVEMERAKEEQRAKARRENANTTLHLSRRGDCYRVRLKRASSDIFMVPAHVSRLGAATRKGMRLVALCGEHQARGPDFAHRRTTRRHLVTCEACLVLLDRELERGTAQVVDDVPGSVGLRVVFLKP